MSAAGKYIRSRFPVIYHFLVSVISKIKSLRKPYTIYITDSLGGSFKSYFISNDMPSAITLLKKNLDTESQNLIDVIIQRLLFYPDEKFKVPLPKNKTIIGGLLPVETHKQKEIIKEHLNTQKRTLSLPNKNIGESVLYFYHGLTILPKQVLSYIKNQHFLDIGAYVGDSAIALNNFKFSKIFSLEISQKSIEKFKVNLKSTGIPEEKYTILNIGVAATNDKPPYTFYDTGSAGLSLFRTTGKYDEIEVERKTTDRIVTEHNIQPKFIKVDIEGAALDFVTGAKETLKKNRPVLSIAIYHNPKEFFEVKPFLEETLENYTFLIRKLASGVKNNLIHSEIILLGYPNEIIAAKTS